MYWHVAVIYIAKNEGSGRLFIILLFTIMNTTIDYRTIRVVHVYQSMHTIIVYYTTVAILTPF